MNQTPGLPAIRPSRQDWQQAHRQWQQWLQAQGIQPSRFQQQAWRAFEKGQSGIISAPTGSGKTLAALGGPVIQAMVQAIAQSRKETARVSAAQGVRLLWITPLRALASDTSHHLLDPVQALLPQWRIAQRTGDASAKDRAAAQKGRAQLLVTTPESLAILLSSEAASESFRTLQAIVVDEWHELLPSKRGMLLQLNLARLRRLAPALQVWGLSATIGNLQEALSVLVRERAPEQAVLIEDLRSKPFHLRSLIPGEAVRLPWAGHLGLVNLGEVLEQVLAQQSCILFTNTRAQAELWFTALASVWPLEADTLAIHHGSLDQQMRQQVEERLRRRRLRCVVATSSLDLGVDFPAVDLVIQIGGPHTVSRLVQRAGRARHQPGAPVEITAVATQALDLCEFAALRELAQERAFERRPALRNGMDVLSQHAMSMALAGGWEAAQLLDEVRSTAAFEALEPAQWQEVIDFLVQGGTALQAYPQYRRLVQDENGRYVPADAKVARRHRLTIGTIADQSMITVQFLKGGRLGSVEEAFISKLEPGDVFNFAGRSLELFRVENLTAWVRKSTRKGIMTPVWTGGQLPFSSQVGERMQHLLARTRAPESATPLPPEMDYLQPLLALQEERSRVPSAHELLLEVITTAPARRKKNEASSGVAWFLYPFAGRMVHEGLVLLLAHRLAQRQPNTFSWSCNHFGLMLVPAVPLDAQAIDWPALLHTQQLSDDLAAAVNFSEMARRRFREIAQIAGLLNTRMPGMKVQTRQLQVSAGLLFDVLSKYDPQHVLLQQAHREAMERDLLLPDLQAALERMAAQQWVLTTPPRHTPFSFGLWAESMRGQLSNESWLDRVRRMARTMER